MGGAEQIQRTSLRNQEFEIDRHCHGEIARAVGVELVAGTTGGAVGDELRPQTAGSLIERRPIEIRHTIEDTGVTDEFIEPFSFFIFRGRPVCGTRAAEGRNDGGADHADRWYSGSDNPDYIAHARFDGFDL